MIYNPNDQLKFFHFNFAINIFPLHAIKVYFCFVCIRSVGFNILQEYGLSEQDTNVLKEMHKMRCGQLTEIG